MNIKPTEQGRHAPGNPAGGRRLGFTLVEMILAIGVAAIVLVAVNAVLFTSLHLREVTTAAVDAALPLDLTSSILRRDLECLVTPTNGTTKIISGNFRIGTINSEGVSEPVAAELFTATGALSANAPWADIQRVTYELKNSTDGSGRRDLYRSVSRNLLTIGQLDVTDQLLLNGVDSVKFSGYDGSRWVEAWDTSDASSTYTNLPIAVRVEIQMQGSGTANQPIVFVVPVDSVTRTNLVLATTSGS